MDGESSCGGKVQDNSLSVGRNFTAKGTQVEAKHVSALIMHRITTRNRPLTLNEINLAAISEPIEYSLDFKKGINYCLRIGEQKRVYLKNWWS